MTYWVVVAIGHQLPLEQAIRHPPAPASERISVADIHSQDTH